MVTRFGVIKPTFWDLKARLKRPFTKINMEPHHLPSLVHNGEGEKSNMTRLMQMWKRNRIKYEGVNGEGRQLK